MNARRGAAAVCLLALALLVGLLATDVRAWQPALATGDAVYAAAPQRATWTPSTYLGSAAETLLGLREDVALRLALQRYRASLGGNAELETIIGIETGRAQAGNALLAAARDQAPGPASQALTLSAILDLGPLSGGVDRNHLASGIAGFSDAIRSDPTNGAAKFDLELVLRLAAAQRLGAGLRKAEGHGRATRHHPPTLRAAGGGY